MILCPNCGTQKAPNQAICSNCGTRACPTGHTMGQFSQYCSKCNWKDSGWKPPDRSKAQDFASPPAAEFADTNPESGCPICRAKMTPNAEKCLNCGYIFNVQPRPSQPMAAAASRATITPVAPGSNFNAQQAPLVMPVKPDYACPQCKSRVPPHTNKCLVCGFVGEMTYIIPQRQTTVSAPFPGRPSQQPAVSGFTGQPRAQVSPVTSPPPQPMKQPGYAPPPPQQRAVHGAAAAKGSQPGYPGMQSKAMPEGGMKRSCPSCRGSVPPDSGICPQCGFRMGMNRPPSKMGLNPEEFARNYTSSQVMDMQSQEENSYSLAGTDVKDMGRRTQYGAKGKSYAGEKQEKRREKGRAMDTSLERKFPVGFLVAILLLSAAIVAVVIVITSKMFAPSTPAVSPLIIKDVTATMVADNQASASWTTNDQSSSQVIICDPDGICTWTEPDKNMVTAHTVTIPNIKTGVKYHLTVKSIDSGGHEATAETSIGSATSVPTPSSPSPAGATPPVIKDTTVSSITESSAVIKWTTDKDASSQVEYGVAATYGTSSQLDEMLMASHSVSLSGLTPDTTYHFRVKSKDAGKNEALSADQTFKTLSSVSSIPIGIAKGNRAPDFTLKNINGEDVKLSSLKGKVVLLNFWFIGCTYCIAEMPYIQAVKETWTKKELVVLAVNIQDSADQIKAWLASKGYTFSLLIGSGVDSLYKVTTAPTTFFIDANGIIQKSQVGSFDNQSQIEAILNSL
jgi:peroxiredoxin